jgi:hypothetical protein
MKELPLDERGQIPGQMELWDIKPSKPRMRRVPPRAAQTSPESRRREPVSVAELVRRKLSATWKS